MTIDEFVAEVERRAEQKMLLTLKLEGAHYAAMKELQAELRVVQELEKANDKVPGSLTAAVRGDRTG